MSTSPSLSDSDSGPPTARGTRRPRGGSSSPESGSAFDDSGGGDEATSSSSGDEVQPSPSASTPYLPARVPLGALLSARADGTDGGAASGAARAAAAARRARARGGDGPARRANKNRPTEAPIHKRPPKLRQVIQTTAVERRDPRFDPLVLARGEKGGSAALAAKKARKRGVAAAAADPAAARYAFLYDETLPAERDDVVAQLRKAKAPAARAALQARLTRLSQALAAERTRRAAVERERARRAVERTAVRGGKAPFYPKASDLRRQALAARFDALKADGKLDAHLAKRRKRNAAKDHRYLPSVRREG